MKKGLKIFLIVSLCALVVVGSIVGLLWHFSQSGDPVEVRPVDYCSAGYYDNGVQYDGRVTAENLQSIYPSGTQTITEIFVTQGQTVRKGDRLLSYDTTLTEIQLERKKIAVQEAELTLQRAKEELAKINAMKPYSPPPETQPTEPPTTQPLTPVEALPYDMGGTGTREDPYRWLWSEELSYDQAFLEEALGEQDQAWLAFEVREANSLEGHVLSCWGLAVTRTAAEEGAAPSFKYQFFTPSYEDPTPPDVEEPDPWVDNSSGYTSAEIAQMRIEKEREIRDLDVKHRLSQVEYEAMVKEAENGMIFSTVDGTVTVLNDEETAVAEGLPLMVVSGGGCFNVHVPLGEFDRERYTVGTPVTVMSWMSGSELTGTVISVSDLPTTGYYYGNGNPNVTLYGATIAVDADSGLQEGEYVSVSFGATQEGEEVLYLDNMYIRTENGQAYVYKRGDDGKLEKVYVSLGEGLWNSYTAVYGDLTSEDYIAFPYGKDVKPGADTVEEDMNSFYG